MIDWQWFTATGSEILMVFLSGVGIFLALLLFTRMAGLRSYSKMSSFDFSITVAFGSILATTVLAKDPSLLVGAAALASLYLIQFLVSKLRRSTSFLSKLIDNQPILIMAREQVLKAHLDATRMTEADLKYKLREAGITHPKQVLAVVFESTGDVSVLKISDDVDLKLFEGVKGAEKLDLSDHQVRG